MNGCLSWVFSWFLPPQVSYEHAKLRISTLDLVYFCQLGTWTGPFVALFSGKMITHMGVVWRHPETKELYVLEAVRHPDTAADMVDGGRVHQGVRLVSFHEKLQHPTDRYFVCVQPIIMERAVRERAERAFNRFILEENNVPFETSPACFFLTQLPGNWRLHRGEDTSTLFCSELAALALRDCGLLRGVSNVSAVYPSMLYSCELTLEHGAVLSGHKFLVRMERSIGDDSDMVRRPRLPPPPRLSAAARPPTEMSPEQMVQCVDDIVGRLQRGQMAITDVK